MRRTLIAFTAASLMLECTLVAVGVAGSFTPRWIAGVLCVALCAGMAHVTGMVRRNSDFALPEAVRWEAACVLAAVLLGCACAVRIQMHCPDGAWDAWAIWNVRARHLFLCQGNWIGVLAAEPAASHPDYPPLLPLVIAGAWRLSGQAQDAVPFCIGLLAYAGACLSVYGCLMRLWWLDAKIAAGMALVFAITPELVRSSASQYAEVPLAFHAVAAFLLLGIGLTERSRVHCALGGLVLAMTAATKNEGMVIAAVVLAATMVSAGMLHAEGRRVSLGSLASVALGAAPLLALLVAFKILVAPGSDLTQNRTVADLLSRVLDLHRHAQIAKAMLLQPAVTANWGWTGCGLGVLFAYGIAVRRRVLCPPAALVAAGMALVYYVVYLLTPHDLKWHIHTTIDRLPLHTYAFWTIWAAWQLKPPECRGTETPSQDELACTTSLGDSPHASGY